MPHRKKPIPVMLETLWHNLAKDMPPLSIGVIKDQQTVDYASSNAKNFIKYIELAEPFQDDPKIFENINTSYLWCAAAASYPLEIDFAFDFMIKAYKHNPLNGELPLWQDGVRAIYKLWLKIDGATPGSEYYSYANKRQQEIAKRSKRLSELGVIGDIATTDPAILAIRKLQPPPVETPLSFSFRHSPAEEYLAGWPEIGQGNPAAAQEPLAITPLSQTAQQRDRGTFGDPFVLSFITGAILALVFVFIRLYKTRRRPGISSAVTVSTSDDGHNKPQGKRKKNKQKRSKSDDGYSKPPESLPPHNDAENQLRTPQEIQQQLDNTRDNLQALLNRADAIREEITAAIALVGENPSAQIAAEFAVIDNNGPTLDSFQSEIAARLSSLAPENAAENQRWLGTNRNNRIFLPIQTALTRIRALKETETQARNKEMATELAGFRRFYYTELTTLLGKIEAFLNQAVAAPSERNVFQLRELNDIYMFLSEIMYDHAFVNFIKSPNEDLAADYALYVSYREFFPHPDIVNALIDEIDNHGWACVDCVYPIPAARAEPHFFRPPPQQHTPAAAPMQLRQRRQPKKHTTQHPPEHLYFFINFLPSGEEQDRYRNITEIMRVINEFRATDEQQTELTLACLQHALRFNCTRLFALLLTPSGPSNDNIYALRQIFMHSHTLFPTTLIRFCTSLINPSNATTMDAFLHQSIAENMLQAELMQHNMQDINMQFLCRFIIPRLINELSGIVNNHELSDILPGQAIHEAFLGICLRLGEIYQRINQAWSINTAAQQFCHLVSATTTADFLKTCQQFRDAVGHNRDTVVADELIPYFNSESVAQIISCLGTACDCIAPQPEVVTDTPHP